MGVRRTADSCAAGIKPCMCSKVARLPVYSPARGSASSASHLIVFVCRGLPGAQGRLFYKCEGENNIKLGGKEKIYSRRRSKKRIKSGLQLICRSGTRIMVESEEISRVFDE